MVTYGTIKKISGQRVTLEIALHDIEKLVKFDETDFVRIEIKRQKDKRTLEQNKYIWRLISMIDEKINGFAGDEMEIYCQVIEEARIKTEYIQALEEAKKYLEETFRVVKELERRGNSVLYRCYIGTSQFTKEEMSNFIDVLINRALREGLDVLEFEKRLKKE